MSLDLTARRWFVVGALGINQILAWGSSYYLTTVLANPVAADTGWSLTWVVGGFTLGLLAAGAASPRIGREIDRRGGRPVLALGAALIAAGQAGLGLAPNLPLFLASWVVLGVGMGAGLYDAAFAALGRLYGQQSRGAITGLTLYGGFASTVCWPLSVLLTETLGWRGACLVYAAINLLIVLPLAFALPREERRAVPVRPEAATGSDGADGGRRSQSVFVYATLAVCFTLSAVITAVVSVFVVTFLEARGVALAAAVGLAALIGPSQVGARVIEMVAGRGLHPVWTMVLSTLLVAGGLAVLLAGLPLIAAGLIAYGAGVGIRSIARGTLPMALFGPTGYATLMGRLGSPAMFAQALAPAAGAWLLERGGVTATLAVLEALALLNVAAALALVPASRRRTGT
jgi:predicted MFS family arabinose efflux permease